MAVMSVHPGILTWAREYRGLSTNGAAKLTGLDEGELIAYVDGNPPTIGGEQRGLFLDELESYIETYKPRERPDVVYVSVRR